MGYTVRKEQNMLPIKPIIVLTGASGEIGKYLINKLGADYEIIGTYNKHEPSSDRLSASCKVDVCDERSVEKYSSSCRQAKEYNPD